MARGQNQSTGRSARSEGLPSIGQTMSQGDAERYLIKNANRGYPADKNDLLAQYGEEASEMRANGMRAPTYNKWLGLQAGRVVRAKERDNVREKLLATPEGKRIEAGFILAKELNTEAATATRKARDTLETKFREVAGQFLDDYMDEQSRRGLSMSQIDDRIKSTVPDEYAKLETASAKEKTRYEEYRKREGARQQFFNP